MAVGREWEMRYEEWLLVLLRCLGCGRMTCLLLVVSVSMAPETSFGSRACGCFDLGETLNQ